MDDLHPREVKAGSNINAGAVDCVVLMRGENRNSTVCVCVDAGVCVCKPSLPKAWHRHRRRKKTWKLEKKKRKSDRNHQVGQLKEVEIRNSLPHHCGISKSLVKFVLLLQRPLDLEQQGIEFGPVGRVLGKATVFSGQGVLWSLD